MSAKLEKSHAIKTIGTEGQGRDAYATVESVDSSEAYREFVADLKVRFPWRFTPEAGSIERDYLRIVQHHLDHLMPQLKRYVNPNITRVLDFGCGSGGSAIALTLLYPGLRCYGTDIDADEIEVANERAKLYGVGDRCEFMHVKPGKPLPFPGNSFDLVICSSVIEYATEPDVRRFCVREMVRNASPSGLLFFSVPNRLYPYEIHTGKWGWNYFPGMLSASTVDSSFWEVQSLARPDKLTLYRPKLLRLLTPWSAFCLQKGAA